MKGYQLPRTQETQTLNFTNPIEKCANPSIIFAARKKFCRTVFTLKSLCCFLLMTLCSISFWLFLHLANFIMSKKTFQTLRISNRASCIISITAPRTSSYNIPLDPDRLYLHSIPVLQCFKPPCNWLYLPCFNTQDICVLTLKMCISE